MATIDLVIKSSERKQDGTWRVYIQIIHKGKPDWIKTDSFVDRSQINRDNDIKDDDIRFMFRDTIKRYRDEIAKMNDLEDIDAKDVKQRLLSLKESNKPIDFVKYINSLIAEKKRTKKTGSVPNYITVRNSLIDYFGTEEVPMARLTTEFLYRYSDYLRKERHITRPNGRGGKQDYILKPMNEDGVFKHLSNLSALFGNAKKEFNKGKVKLIKENPFEDFSKGTAPKPKKRAVPIDKVAELFKAKAKPGSRAELGRDISLLSFYLCGMNSRDIFELPPYNYEERLEYNRSKTEDSRKDGAFFSVYVVEEAKPLLHKYAGTLQSRYADHKALTKAINKGLKDLNLSYYATHYVLRHTFADTADKLGISTDKIAHAMNHVVNPYVVTGMYIGFNWKKVDKVQSKVMKAFRKAL